MSIVAPELDVFVADPTFLNPSVFSLWLQGETLEQAIETRLALEGNLFATPSIISGDTNDQYQLFDMLEHFFHNPKYLSSQLLVPLAPVLQQMILERYYSFDDAVVRELLGKKLSARVRKDLDDVSEKARVSLQNCRRQFDNLKRIFKAVEDTQGGLEETIQTMFLLSTETSKKYARIVFLCSNRFETNKKKLAFLTFSDFMHFAAVLMSEWTVKGAPPGEDLDPVFLQDLRDLKACFTNDREILAEQRNLVKSAMISNSSPFHHPPQLHHPHLPHHPSLSSTTGSTASTSFASTAASSSISSPLPNAQLSSYLGAGAGAGGADNSTATTTMTTTTQPPVHASSLSSFASASAPQAQAPISSSTPGPSTSFPHTSEKHHLPSISSSASSSSSSTVALPHVTGPAWPKLSVEEREQNYNKKVFPIFKTLVRNLLTIGAGLSQSKELRDVFIDLVEKIVEPCRDADWTVEDMEYFFTALLRTFDSLESINRGLRMRYSSMYQRYIRAVMLCSCRMLKRLNKN